MAIKFNRSQTFATNGTVTAAGLHNLIDGTDIYQALITDQTAMTSVGSLDKLLIADSDLTAADAPRSVTVNELFEDALTLSTYTNANAVNLKYTSATGNYTLSTGATITNGTITSGVIPSLTAGTTTSTAATITAGTIPTLTTGTTTSTAEIVTSGTIATLNSTTGTIATLNSTNATISNLSATTSTFLGAITGSTNVINIGSGQVYKNSSGDVGIGTTSPSRQLSVSGASAAFGITSTAAGGNTVSIDPATTANSNLAQIDCSGANALRFNTNSAERLRIASAGQIGIGGANYGTSGQVLTSAGASTAPSWQTVSAITSGTAVASTSGTAIDFTSIPSTAKRITVMYTSLQISGSSNVLFQLGTSGGIQTNNYLGSGVFLGSSSGASNYTTGFGINSTGSSNVMNGQIILSLLNLSTGIWVANGISGLSNLAFIQTIAGSKTLSGTLDRLRITTVNGTDTFTAGSINIMYES
jgi:hypothetical protein